MTIKPIEWDNAVSISGKKYLSSEILSNGAIVKIDIDGGSQELYLSAKDWIILELETCRKELEKNKKSIRDKQEKNKELKELVLLNKYFNAHVTKFDVIGMHEFGNDEKNKILDENIDQIKEHIKSKISKLKAEIVEIKNNEVNIKMICSNNIKGILKLDGSTKFAYYADHLMHVNGLEFGKNSKLKAPFINSYSINQTK